MGCAHRVELPQEFLVLRGSGQHANSGSVDLKYNRRPIRFRSLQEWVIQHKNKLSAFRQHPRDFSDCLP